MGAGISTETYVSNIKCYGELSRQNGHNCYTHRELMKMAKEKGLKRSGTKQELAKRLRLKYIDYKKYSGLYSSMGLYEYRLIHVDTIPRYINGKLESVHSRYCNRIAGMMMEKLIALGSNQEKFVKSKALTLLRTTQKELDEATEDLDFTESDIKIWKDDIGKIMDKYELEHTGGDLKFLTRVLYSVDRIRNKENSVKFAVISTSMGGAIQYVYPDFFELIKFEGMYRKDKDGRMSIYISPLLGVYYTHPKSVIRTDEPKYNSFHSKGRLNQLCLVGIPYLGFYLQPKEPTALIHTKKRSGSYLLRCIYVEAPKLDLPKECEYLNYFHTGALKDYTGFDMTVSTNFGFCVNNIMLEDHGNLTIPFLPDTVNRMNKGALVDFFDKHSISDRSLANRLYFKVKDEKYRGYSLSKKSERSIFVLGMKHHYISKKDAYSRYYNGKWTLREMRAKLGGHPVGPIYTISEIIQTYIERSGRPFITKDDIKRSVKMSKAYYNEVLSSKDVEVSSETLKDTLEDLPRNINFVRSGGILTEIEMKQLLHLPITKEDIKKEKERKEAIKKEKEKKEEERKEKIRLKAIRKEEERKEAIREATRRSELMAKEKIRKEARRKEVTRKKEKKQVLFDFGVQEEIKVVEKVERLTQARNVAKGLKGDQIVVSLYTKNTLIILGPGTKKYKDIFKKHGASWKRRMKVWMTSIDNRSDLMNSLAKAKVPYIEV